MAATKENLIKKIYKTLKLKGYDVNYAIKISELDQFNFFLPVNGEEICVSVEKIETDGKKIIIWGTYAKQGISDDMHKIVLCKEDLRCKDIKFIFGEIQCFEFVGLEEKFDDAKIK